MKKIIFSLFSIILLSMNITQAMAAWYEATGSASIVSSEDNARRYALEDALYKVVNFSGGDIGAMGNILPLLESNQKEYQFANHEVQYILVEKQGISHNKMVVKIRVDIYPSAMACHTQQYKKTILFGSLDITSPQQAVMGQVYNLGADFNHLLRRQIAKTSVSFLPVGDTEYKINKQDPSQIKMIAEDYDAQYIISGKINDLTATLDPNLASSNAVNRQFALELSAFDGQTGHEVFHKNYRNIALWPFAKTSIVDTSSARFWQSTYGEMLQRVSRSIMLDLEAKLACKITLPTVVAKFNHKITMDLGRIHGVRVGDRLQLWHTASFIDQHGISRNKVSHSQITLTVSRVYQKEAELTIDQPELATSIQIGDVMNKIN